MFSSMSAPRLIIVYQESKHSVGFVPSANLGPNPYTTMAEWMRERLAGKALVSERWYVDNTGRVNKTPY
jgi:hypothetical protein